MENYKDRIKKWSDEDKDWIEKHVAENFRMIAARHGRMAFNLVMQIGLANGACARITAHSQHMGNKLGPELREATQLLANILNDLVGFAANAKGITPIQLRACKIDIETMGALSLSTPNTKEGKLILPS